MELLHPVIPGSPEVQVGGWMQTLEFLLLSLPPGGAYVRSSTHILLERSRSLIMGG